MPLAERAPWPDQRAKLVPSDRPKQHMHVVGHDHELTQPITSANSETQDAFNDILAGRGSQKALTMSGVEILMHTLRNEFAEHRRLLWTMRRRVGRKPLLPLVLPSADLLPRQTVGEPEGDKVNRARLFKVGQMPAVDEGCAIPVKVAELDRHCPASVDFSNALDKRLGWTTSLCVTNLGG